MSFRSINKRRAEAAKRIRDAIRVQALNKAPFFDRSKRKLAGSSSRLRDKMNMVYGQDDEFRTDE